MMMWREPWERSNVETPENGFEYMVYSTTNGAYAKDGHSGRIIYSSKSFHDVFNYVTENLLEPHETLYVAPADINYEGELRFYKSQHIIIPYLYVHSNDREGDILSNFYTEKFGDGMLYVRIESDGGGNLLGVDLADADGAVVDIYVKNVSESGLYAVRPTNSRISVKTYSTGYAATAGMEGAVFEGGSNNMIFADIYDAYRDGVVFDSSHDNTLYGKIKKTGRHGIYLNNSHNNVAYVSLEDIRARAGTFGNPDGCGVYISSCWNDAIVASLTNPSYTPDYDAYINGNGGNIVELLSSVHSKTYASGGVVRTRPNYGVATFSGDGSTTQFTIAHGLVSTPSKVLVTPMSSDATGDFYVTADGTNITVTYKTAPPSGTDNVKLGWYAEV